MHDPARAGAFAGLAESRGMTETEVARYAADDLLSLVIAMPVLGDVPCLTCAEPVAPADRVRGNGGYLHRACVVAGSSDAGHRPPDAPDAVAEGPGTGTGDPSAPGA